MWYRTSMTRVVSTRATLTAKICITAAVRSTRSACARAAAASLRAARAPRLPDDPHSSSPVSTSLLYLLTHHHCTPTRVPSEHDSRGQLQMSAGLTCCHPVHCSACRCGRAVRWMIAVEASHTPVAASGTRPCPRDRRCSRQPTTTTRGQGSSAQVHQSGEHTPSVHLVTVLGSHTVVLELVCVHAQRSLMLRASERATVNQGLSVSCTPSSTGPQRTHTQRTCPRRPSSTARSSNRSCVGKLLSSVDGVYSCDDSRNDSKRRRYLRGRRVCSRPGLKL